MISVRAMCSMLILGFKLDCFFFFFFLNLLLFRIMCVRYLSQFARSIP